MGFHPLLCRRGQCREQTILLDDVVQRASPLSQFTSLTPKTNHPQRCHLWPNPAPWLSDRVLGPLNVTIMMNIFTLLVVLAIWLPLGGLSVTALFVVVVLMGIGTGSFVPLGGKGAFFLPSPTFLTSQTEQRADPTCNPKVSCINALCKPESTGTWLGFAYALVSFA